MATHDSDMKKTPGGASGSRRGKGAAEADKSTQTSKRSNGSKSASTKDKGTEGTGRKGSKM